MHVAVRRRCYAGLAVVALAGGCSLTTPLGGLSSGGPSVTPEAGADSPALDGSLETSGDADADASPIDPCAGSIFCDRFERADPKGSWSYIQEISGGTLAIDGATSVSPTRSLLMTIPPGIEPRAYLTFESPTSNHRHGRVDWSAMSDGQPDREAQLMRIQLSSAQRDSFVFVSLVPGENIVLAEQRDETGVSSGATYSNIVLDKVFAPGKWQRWSMELDATTSPAKAKVTVDGVLVGTKNLSNPFDTGELRIILGATYVRDGKQRKVWYDDVALFALD